VLRGMLHSSPGPDGLSLDLMRRDPSADNGLNELMIVRLIEGCPELGPAHLADFAVPRPPSSGGEKIGAARCCAPGAAS